MIYELRRYTLRPGTRDTMISLFEREFLETQDMTGMEVVGQFRDPDAPDTFVWMRKFRDMEARRQALTDFYSGPAWKEHRDAARATMIDTDDVLLLRPVLVAPFSEPTSAPPRPPAGATELPRSRYVATVHHVTDGYREHFARTVAPALAAAGVALVACFETEHAENTYPALPVREGENVFVWFARFDSATGYRDLADLTALHATPPSLRLRLEPTARSRVR